MLPVAGGGGPRLVRVRIRGRGRGRGKARGRVRVRVKAAAPASRSRRLALGGGGPRGGEVRACEELLWGSLGGGEAAALSARPLSARSSARSW